MGSVRPRRWFSRLFARTAEKPRVSEYHAVSICCGDGACEAAREKVGARYLSAAAPLLPLAQCDRPDECECRYQHYDDRRSTARRGTDQGLPEQNNLDRIERRYAKDRREQHEAEDAEPFSVHEGSYYEHMGDTVRTEMLKASEVDGVDPYNSGSFDRSKIRDADSDE